MITDEQLALALDRIAHTGDGELLYRYLQKTLLGVIASLEVSDGALRENLGRRRFAAELMAMMAKGIDESGGRADTGGTGVQRSERTVVFASRPPVETGRQHRSSRDRIIASDPELLALRAGDGTAGGT